MRKQFDLEYYLAHPETRVVTRDGRSARILCTDLDDKNYPIAATCINSSRNGADVDNYTANGKVLLNDRNEHSRDLFFDLPYPVKKRMPLTYDDLLERIKSGKTMWLVNDRDIVFNIIDFDFVNVYYINGDAKEILPESYEDLMNAATFVDGDPCWKEVDSCDTCTNDKGCVTCNDGDQWKGGDE